MKLLDKLETRFQEIVFLFGVFVFPLLSYGVIATIGQTESQEFQHHLGAWGFSFFSSLWTLFGYAALVMPLFFAELTYAVIKRFQEFSQTLRQYPFFLWRLTLYTLFMTGISTYLGIGEAASLAEKGAEASAVASGGQAGTLIGHWLQAKLGTYGAFGILSFVFIGTAVLSGLLDIIGAAISLGNLVHKGVMHIYSKFNNEVINTTEALSHGHLNEAHSRGFSPVEADAPRKTSATEILFGLINNNPDLKVPDFIKKPDENSEEKIVEASGQTPSVEKKTPTPTPKKTRTPSKEISVVEKTDEVLSEGAQEEEQKEFRMKPVKKKGKLPSKNNLSSQKKIHVPSKKELDEQAKVIEERLEAFGVPGKVSKIHPGLRLTMFEFQPKSGVKLSKISALTQDLALLLGAPSIRILAPIPGKTSVGIEVPNTASNMLQFSTCLPAIKKAQKDKKMNLPVLIGEDVTRDVRVEDLSAMPHMLVSGTTGSGKSVFVNTLINSLIYTKSPKELRMIMVDPKMIELTPYNNIPHMAQPVISDVEEAKNILQWAEREMDRRYRAFSDLGARNIESFNEKIKHVSKSRVEAKVGGKIDWDFEEMPYLVIIVDELADLMITQGKEVEIPITRIAQKARACGIHMVLCTQRPSSDIVTGLIKTNFPSRVSFKVSSGIDSRTILDTQGAEKLLGHGDMLFLPNGKAIERYQGAFISEKDVNAVVADLLS